MKNKMETMATRLLRLIGASICTAMIPAFFPLNWMNAIHGWLGLGEIPHQPIFEYLARSLCLMYFAHGCMVLAVSTDVVRYRPLVFLIGGLNLLLGALLILVDYWAKMPMFWTAMEGPPIFGVGILLLWIARSISEDSPNGDA